MTYPRRVRLVAMELHAPTVQLGATWTFNEVVYDESGDLVGHAGSTCTVTSVYDESDGVPEFICVGSLYLNGVGQLIITGLYQLGAHTFMAALTGGTGRFRGRQGQARFTQISSTESWMDISLVGDED